MTLPPEIEAAFCRAEARGLIRYAAAPLQGTAPTAPKPPAADPSSGREVTQSEIESAFCRAEARGLIRGRVSSPRTEMACRPSRVPAGDRQPSAPLDRTAISAPAGPGLRPFMAAVRALVQQRGLPAQDAALTVASLHRCGAEADALLQTAKSWCRTHGGSLAEAYREVLSGPHPG